MDHALYDFEPAPARTTRRWPGGEGLAAFVVVCLEHWESIAPEGTLRDPRFVGEFGSFSPDYRSWTQREYGLRIGIFRVLDVLRAAGIVPAIAANAMVLARVPSLVERLSAQGCEWVAHGTAATRMMHARMPVDAQRATIAESVAAIEKATGVRCRGWLSQDRGATPHTASLLAEAGLAYTLDWTNDDAPYRMKTAPPLLSVPLSVEWDDVECQWLRNQTPRAHGLIAREAFDRLREEGERHPHGACFGLTLHPWVCGMSSRIAALRDLVDALRRQPGVWWTTPGAIERAFGEPVPGAPRTEAATGD
ncbi:MAG: hypothetical protein AB7P21_02775 [Lautropia sp.]